MRFGVGILERVDMWDICELIRNYIGARYLEFGKNSGEDKGEIALAEGFLRTLIVLEIAIIGHLTHSVIYTHQGDV